MDLVIELQGFRDRDFNFVAKEIALVGVNRDCISHWIVRPYEAFGKLPTAARTQNNWLTRYYHGIEWHDGDVTMDHLRTELREYVRNADRIFTRGKEKAEFLHELLSREIHNLETVSPAYKKLPEESSCAFHAIAKNEAYVCALNNAIKLEKWLAENLNELEKEENALDNEHEESKGNHDKSVNTENEYVQINITAQDTNSSVVPGVATTDPVIEKEEEKKEEGEEEEEEEEEEEQTVYENATSPNEVTSPSNAPSSTVTSTNEYSGNCKSVPGGNCESCGSLSCGQNTEGVDTVDGARR